MRRDQSPRHEDERDDGRPIGPKSKKEEKPREGEQISEGRGCRMGGSVRVGDGADQESRGEEGDTILARGTPRDEEHREHGQRTQDRHEEVQYGRKVESGQVDKPYLNEEHARKIRIRDPPPVVHRGDVMGLDEAPEEREILARIRTPVQERPERRESDGDRAEDEGRQTEGRRLPHSSANRRALLKG